MSRWTTPGDVMVGRLLRPNKCLEVVDVEERFYFGPLISSCHFFHVDAGHVTSLKPTPQSSPTSNSLIMWIPGVLAVVVPLFASVLAHSHSSTGNSVLVVLEDKLKKEDYSTFFEGLES